MEMRFQRRTLGACLSLAATPASSFHALSRRGPAARTIIGHPTASPRVRVRHPADVSSSTTKTTTTALRGGFWKSLFGGGAYESKIDYESLPHPCPELARAALEGAVVTTSERDPSLFVATFAGGCFWGLELHFQRLPGVVHTAVGYTQGREEEPTYDQVTAGATGHTEAVMVYFNPADVSYDGLLDAFFSRVDPTTVNGQGNDRGRQYRTGVYVHNKDQEESARLRFEEEAKRRSPRPIATELRAAASFWPAEKYHQRYLERGGRFGTPQSAEKNCSDEIRCYG